MFRTISRRLLLASPLAGLARPAEAHAILLESTPAAGATVKPGVTDLRMRFNSRIDVARSRITLVGPDHAPVVLAITSDHPDVVLSAVATLAPGLQSLRWQVLAIDGHITRGEIRFTVAAP